MSKTIAGYKITANRTPYRRAGLNLNTPLSLPTSAVTDAQLKTLRADPVVHIEKVEIEAEGETPADGVLLEPARNEAELIDQIQQVEDLQSLDTIGDGEQRPAVIQAIEAARERIQAAAKPAPLPTRKADLQAWLTERNVAFEEADTVPVLTEKAQAVQAQQTEGGE